MSRKRVALVLGLALMLVVAGCAGAEEEEGEDKPESVENMTAVTEIQEGVPTGDGVYRIEDSQAQTVCYVFLEGGDVNGMDCVQLS